ncbi:MAG: MATE family efflux transporter [Spirochaetales bacterium]|nr:MATE family efflux transporter [Spirochaetales bacterium]
MASIGLPVVFQGLLNNSLSFVDTLMFGQLGEASIAAVALANQMFFLISLLYFGVCSAAAIFLSQFWGAGNRTNIQRVLGLSVIVAGIAALAMATVSLLFPEAIMGIFTDDLSVIQSGKEYLEIVAISYIFSALTQIMSTALRVTGHAKTPLKVALLALTLNAVGNYLLIFGIGPFPAWGVAGAALSTTIARLLEMSILLIIVYRRHPVLAIRGLAAFRIDRRFLAHVVPTSLPVILNEIFWSLGMVFYKIAYARMGIAAIAAINVTEAIGNLFFVALMGVSNATLIMIGIKIGEGQVEDAHRYARRFILSGIVIGVVMGLFEALFAPMFANFFNISDAVRALAITCLYIHALMLWIRSVNIVIIVGILRSGGDTRYSMIAELVGVWAVGVPIAFIGSMVLQLNITTLYLLLGLEEVTKMVLGLWRIKSKKWVNDLTTVH